MQRDDREIELEIVSNPWLSLNDPAGYDALVASWADKIDRHAERDLRGEPVSLVDGVVARQLDPIMNFLGDEIDVRHVDPLEREIADSSGPAMVLSPDGTVAAMANGAEDAFGVSPGHRAGSGCLDERSRDDFESLRRSILRSGNVGYAIIRIVGRDGSEGLAEAYGLTAEKYAGTFTVVRSLELAWSPEVSAKLEQAYGLTETEAEICRLLFELRDLDAVSRRRGVTQGTGRVQLKRIFAKMDIHAKADLVRLLAMLCARSQSGDDSASLEWSDPTGRQAFVERADGRKLAYSWTGAEDGRPAIFIHGELPLFYLPGYIQDLLADAGVKLLCLSMPGHGSSDPSPEGIRQSEDALSAAKDLIARIGAPVPVVASFSGMSTAMQLGSEDDPLVSALAIIGMPWSITPEAYRSLPMAQKTLSQLAKRSPRMFELVCRLGWRMMIREGPDFYLTRALNGSQSDERLVRDANMQPYLRAASRHLVAQGHKAFVRETLKGAESTPKQLLADLRVPLHWLIPADEPSCTPSNVRAAKSMNPLITVEVVDDAGELMPYQRPDVFVRCMADLVGADPAAAFAANDALAIAG